MWPREVSEHKSRIQRKERKDLPLWYHEAIINERNKTGRGSLACYETAVTGLSTQRSEYLAQMSDLRSSIQYSFDDEPTEWVFQQKTSPRRLRMPNVTALVLIECVVRSVSYLRFYRENIRHRSVLNLTSCASLSKLILYKNYEELTPYLPPGEAPSPCEGELLSKCIASRLGYINPHKSKI